MKTKKERASAPAKAKSRPGGTKKRSTAQAVSVPPAAYNEIVAQARLETIRLIQSSFVVHPRYGAAEKSLSLGDSIQEVETSAESGTALGLIIFRVEAKDRATDAPLLQFHCSYIVSYSGMSLATDELNAAAKLFVARVGRFAVYPYVRAMVSRVSAEAGAELPILPVLREPRKPPRADSGAKS